MALGVGGCDARRYRAASRQRRKRPALEDGLSVNSGWSPPHVAQHCADTLAQRTPREKDFLFLRGRSDALASICGFARCRQSQSGHQSLQQNRATEPSFFLRKENGNSVNILLVLRYDPWGAVEPLSWYPPRCSFQTQCTIFGS